MSAHPATALPPGREALESFSRGRGEPDWLTRFRLESLERYLEVPPAGGRYTRLKLAWEGLTPETPSFPAEARLAEGLVPATAAEPSPALALAPWTLSGGQNFLDLAKASQPFDNLVFSSWSYGLVFRWGEGQEDAEVRHLAPEPKGGLILEPLLLDVGAKAKANLFLHWKGSEEPGLRLTTLSGKLGPGAELRIALAGEGAKGHHHISLNLDLAEDARVDLFGAWVGGKWTVLRGVGRMASPGASWKETQLVWGDGKDHADIDTRILHLAPRTRSDVHARAALADSARSVFAGAVVMEKEAVQADARLEDHALLLSRGARSDSVPALEIRAMEVKAAHAASTGQVDAEQLHYLLTRGLDEAQARHLLVKGFLESLLERAPFPILPDFVDGILERKVRS